MNLGKLVSDRRGFVNILFVLIALVIAGVVGYVVVKQKAVAPTEAPTAVNNAAPGISPTTTSIASSSQDETANWKTYRNEKYGFEIKFNPNWKSLYYINYSLLLSPGHGTYPSDVEEANEITINNNF